MDIPWLVRGARVAVVGPYGQVPLRRTVTAVADTFVVLDDGTRYSRTAPHARVNGAMGRIVARNSTEFRDALSVATMRDAGLALERAYIDCAAAVTLGQRHLAGNTLAHALTAWQTALLEDAAVRGPHAPAGVLGTGLLPPQATTGALPGRGRVRRALSRVLRPA